MDNLLQDLYKALADAIVILRVIVSPEVHSSEFCSKFSFLWAAFLTVYKDDLSLEYIFNFKLHIN